MLYKSTRSKETVKDTYALLHGLASDGGLYVPFLFPRKSIRFEDIKDKSYQEVAQFVLSKFFTDFSDSQWKEMLVGAYSKENFDTDDIAPVHTLEENLSVLELFHGRTQAFKDMALSIFPYLLVAAKEVEKEEKDILILTATSGDTGKAALAGFANVPGTYIQVFYPTDGVSQMQKQQMQKQEGDNVFVTAIEGNFDDAQQFLKKIFVDEETKATVAEKGLLFSSANSINIGRLAPQVAYYVKVYEELVGTGAIGVGEAFNIVVPTGNFGNILAAYYAKMMGIPIGKLICASNKNKVLTDFFETGTYDMNRPFYVTLSPSMDILESSNFERFLYYAFQEDSEETKAYMEELKGKGAASVPESVKMWIDSHFKGIFVDDVKTKEVIDYVFNTYGYLMDPHTAVAMGAYMDYVKDNPEEANRHTVIASTAHPFKFPDAISQALRLPLGDDCYGTLENISAITGVAFPKELAKLAAMEIRFDQVIPKESMKDSILRFIDSIKK